MNISCLGQQCPGTELSLIAYQNIKHNNWLDWTRDVEIHLHKAQMCGECVVTMETCVSSQHMAPTAVAWREERTVLQIFGQSASAAS